MMLRTEPQLAQPHTDLDHHSGHSNFFDEGVPASVAALIASSIRGNGVEESVIHADDSRYQH